MPQPLAQSDGDNLQGPDGDLLLQRPPLAIHIAVIAALWTEADVELDHILAYMLGPDPQVVIAIYNSLINANAKIDAVKAVAALKLSQDLYRSLESLLKEYRTRSGERNSIVHGTWVISDDFPNALLLINPTKFLDWSTKITASQSIDEITQLGNNPPNILIYEEADFKSVEARIKELKKKLWDFGAPLHVAFQEQT